MKTYFYLLLFAFSYLQAHAQLAVDWSVTVHEIHRAGFEPTFIHDPKVVADPLGNVYVTSKAGTGGTHDLYIGQPEMLATGFLWDEFYLAQISPQGEANWFFRFSGWRRSLRLSDNPTLFARPEGGVTLVSQVREDVTLGLDTITILDDDRKLLIAQINTEGEVDSYTLTDLKIRRISTITQAPNGDIIIAGAFRDFSGRVGNFLMTSNSSPSYFAARINIDDGAAEWAYVPTFEAEWGFVGEAQLEVLRDGNLALVYSPGGYNFEMNGCPEYARPYIVSKLNQYNGALMWQKEAAWTGFGHIRDIQERANGDLYLVGSFGGRIFANNGERYDGVNTSDCNIMTGCLLKLTPLGDLYDIIIERDGFTGHRIVQLSDGQYLIGGRIDRESRNSFTPEELTSGFIIKLYSAKDQLLFQRNLTTDQAPKIRRYFQDLIMLDDQHIICTGRFDGHLLDEVIYAPIEMYDAQAFIAQIDLSEIMLPPVGTPAETSLNIFPNPTRGFLNIDLGESYFGDQSVQIFDALGRKVFELDGFRDRTQFPIIISELPSGTYTLRLGEDGPISKFVKI